MSVLGEVPPPPPPRPCTHFPIKTSAQEDGHRAFCTNLGRPGGGTFGLCSLRLPCLSPEPCRESKTRKVGVAEGEMVDLKRPKAKRDFCRVPRGSWQILTRKCCSYPLRFCVVFAGFVQGATGIPTNFDRQSCSYPFPFCVVFCRTCEGRQGDPGKF